MRNPLSSASSSLSRAAKRLNCFSHLFKLDQNYYTKADSTDSISGAPASDEKKKGAEREMDGFYIGRPGKFIASTRGL